MGVGEGVQDDLLLSLKLEIFAQLARVGIPYLKKTPRVSEKNKTKRMQMKYERVFNDVTARNQNKKSETKHAKKKLRPITGRETLSSCSACHSAPHLNEAVRAPRDEELAVGGEHGAGGKGFAEADDLGGLGAGEVFGVGTSSCVNVSGAVRSKSS